MTQPEKNRIFNGLGQVAGRVYNFNGGPAALPLPVLEEVASEILNWRGTGMSIMENSHRDKKVVAMALETEETLKELLGLKDEWKVLFLQGGASLQFAMIPMNFAPDGAASDYVNTGMWSDKAYKEAVICGSGAKIIATGEAENFTRIPSGKLDYRPDARYVYLTANNTVRGTEWKSFPTDAPAPLIADMSSDFLSRPLDLSRFALVHAGAQKNVGPAGLTIVLARTEFAKTGKKGLPHLLDYRTYIDSDSMYNTPPVFAIYVAGLVFKWIRDAVGGLGKMAEINEAKAARLYAAIDGSGGYYRGTAAEDSRSLMNVTYRLPSEELEKKFLEEGKKAGLCGLNGHRSVGGIRASVYNAVPDRGVDTLIEFMADFKAKNH
ncbi:MAG: 3-phosphoserine/phosphohydroxythreonine transaminase [Deltaproteobacteria bacterium]|jgi:phosphoserine aminotransferase|nr:3-phosphoserine/phosphohydroxythreonine transaminase [Deltaproteobacteria bacterium]